MASKTKQRSTEMRLSAAILIIILLCIGLCGTTFALVYATVSVENNLFQTGYIDINLNDGKSVIEDHELLFEPGMTVTKPFFIENNSTWDVYYRIYFENVSGGLADVLEITICAGDQVLAQGTARELNREAVSAADDSLQVKERRDLTVTFYFPEDAGNATQGATLRFSLCAEAVQMKNNPDKIFD